MWVAFKGPQLLSQFYNRFLVLWYLGQKSTNSDYEFAMKTAPKRLIYNFSWSQLIEAMNDRSSVSATTSNSGHYPAHGTLATSAPSALNLENFYIQAFSDLRPQTTPLSPEALNTQKVMQQWVILVCGAAPLAIYIHTRPRPEPPPLMIWSVPPDLDSCDEELDIQPYGRWLKINVVFLNSNNFLQQRNIK